MIADMLSYGFMQRAFITGTVIALACSLLGVFLVLRRYALIGDGLAHISFGGVAFGLLFGVSPILSALAFSLLGSLVILRLKEKARLHGDAAIGIVSHASLGAGIFIASIAQGFNVDILSYLFGSILAIKTAEVLLSIMLAAVVLLTIALLYHDLFALTFDEQSARTTGIRTGALNALLISLTAVTVVSAMNVTGLMLASALIVLPAASALQMRQSFKRTLLCSAAIGVFSVNAGLALSYFYDWAASGTIVMLNAALFLALTAARTITVKSR